MAKLTPSIKKDIVKKFKEGIKISKIAQCYDVDHQSIRNVLKNYEKTGDIYLETKYFYNRKIALMNEKEKEIHHLKKRNEYLKMENQVLKQINALFGSKKNAK